jgi:hypothetical protein
MMPSPSTSQYHAEAAVDRSVKATEHGALPDRMLAAKSGTGTTGRTWIQAFFVIVVLPPTLKACSLTV